MKCDEVRVRLSEYLDGEVSPDEKRALAAHLADCEVCRGALAEIERTVGHLRAIGEVEPPPWLAQKVMQRVREKSGKKKGFFHWLFFPLHVKLPVEALAVALVAVAAMYVFNAIKPEVRMMGYTEPLAEAPSPAEPEEGFVALRDEAKKAGSLGQKGLEPGAETEARADFLRKSDESVYRAKKREAVPEKTYAPTAIGEGAASAKDGDLMDREMALKESYAAPEEELRHEERMFKVSVSVHDLREARGAVEGAIKKAGGRLVEQVIAEESVVMAEVASARLTELIKELETIGEVSADSQALPGDYVAVRIELKARP